MSFLENPNQSASKQKFVREDECHNSNEEVYSTQFIVSYCFDLCALSSVYQLEYFQFNSNIIQKS